MRPNFNTDTATTWKNSRFILWEKTNFHMTDNMLISLSVELNSHVNWSTNFRCLPLRDGDGVTAKLFKIPRREFIFRTCEDGAVWHLIPRRISPCSESFLGHIGTGILCGG